MVSILIEILPLLATFSGIFLLGSLLYQLAWLLSSLLVNAMFLTQEEQNTLKAFARRGLIGKFIGFAVLLFNTALRLLSILAQTFLLILYTSLPLIVLASILSIMEQRWGDSVIMVASVLNEPSTPLAQSIQTYIKIPLQILNTIAFYSLPVYNFFVYLFFNLPLEMLVHFIAGNGAIEIQKALTAFSAGFPLFTKAAGDFIRANPLSCPLPSPILTKTSTNCYSYENSFQQSKIQNENFICYPMDLNTVATLCLHPNSRAFDWSGTLEQARLTFTHFLRAIGVGCGALQSFVNLFLYPLTDTYLWQSIGSFLNAILALLVGMPTSTASRCALAGGFSNRPSMCTPDFAPAMQFAVNGSKLLGIAIDNFIDMAFLLIMYGNEMPCPTTNSPSMSLDYWSLDLSLFGTNSTILLALSSTTTWALTDGQHAVFFKSSANNNNNIRRSYHPNLWGLNPINPRYGVAALANHDKMMGCTCSEDNEQNNQQQQGIQIYCYVVGSTGGSNLMIEPIFLNTSWETPSAPKMLTCNTVRIIVESIRWPQKRVSQPPRFTQLPPRTQQSLAADAAVYVIPSCGGKGTNPMACFDPTIFTLGNCFPYCMALHLTSNNNHHNSMTFRSYSSWKEGILITTRDCIPLVSTSEFNQQDQEQEQESEINKNIIVSTTCLQTNDPNNDPNNLLNTNAINQISNNNNQNDISSSSFNLDSICNYASTCNTWVNNKNITKNYQKNNVPAFADIEQQVSLILDGQPIVAAGGLVMRLSKDKSKNQHYVDFPMIVGDQFNEFTMEIASPIGIPVTPIAAVPRESIASEQLGFITLPPNDIELVDIVNPATLSRNELWYAVNPSYDWLYALGKYCTSEGTQSSVQISFISSYAAIRIWKVLYKTGNCYINSFTGDHICKDDVAKGFPLDTSRNIPPSLSLAALGCMQGTEYNLLVESVEYYDDLNIVIAVRRGTIQQLSTLIQKNKTGIEKNTGYMVFYFVNTFNVSQIRENIPWALDPHPNVISGTGILCPALRFLPSFGTFFSKSTEAVFHGLRFALNLFTNPLGLIEIIHARASGVCPSIGLYHTALNDCGMGLFYLEDFFQSLYDANIAFWDILAWIASLFTTPVGTNPNTNQMDAAARFFQSFLSGVTSYGEASQMISLYELTDMANIFDTGVQNSILDTGGSNNRRRRNLLFFQNHNSNNSNFIHNFTGKRRKLLGWKTELGKRAANGIFSGIFSMFTGAFSQSLSLSQSLTSTMMLRATSADYTVLLNMQNPTYMLSSAITAPTLAWAHFSYLTMVPIGLDLSAFILFSTSNPVTPDFFLRALATVWVNLFEARDHYELLVASRLKRGCRALQIMLGYTGGLPRAVYYNCLSAIDMQATMFQLLLLFTAEVPLFRCICVDAAGQPFPKYVIQHCMHWVPSSRKTIWQGILYQNGQNVDNLCAWYGDYLQYQVQHAIDPWIKDSQLAANSLADFLQDLLIPSTTTTGTCSAAESNPHVFTLIPLPSQHYQVCAKTSLCQLRCSTALDLFYFEFNKTINPTIKEPFSYAVSAESPFFDPYASASSSSLYFIDERIVSISTRNQTLHPGCRPCISGCLAIIKTPWTSNTKDTLFTMRIYCIPPPEAIQATVYISGIQEDWSFSPWDTSISNSNTNTQLLQPKQKPITNGILTYCDFALQPHDTVYILLAYSDASLSITQSGMFSSNYHKEGNQKKTIQRLYAVWHDVNNLLKLPQKALKHVILDTDHLSNVLLTPTIQRGILGNLPSEQSNGARVTSCSIQSLVELATGVKGQLLFFFSITFTIQHSSSTNTLSSFTESITGSSSSNNLITTTNGYAHGILLWSDPLFFSNTDQPEEELSFFMPCSSCIGIPPCDQPTLVEGCRPGLDTVLYLAKLGSFIHIESNLYLHIPSDSNTMTPIQFVQIDSNGFTTIHPAPSPFTNYPSSINLNRPIGPSPLRGQGIQSQYTANTGAWTRSDLFALSGLSTRIIRSPILHFNSNHQNNLIQNSMTIRWLQATQPIPTATQWFAEVRLISGVGGFVLRSFGSQNVTTTAKLKTKCSPYSCQACTTPALRLLCTSAQDCMLSRCVGTLVNSKNVLCSVGIMTEQLYLQMISTWRALYLILMEMLMFAIKGFGGSLSQNVLLVFPTDQFYTLVCSCKDVYASSIAMAMAVVESMRGLMQTGRIDLGAQLYMTPEDSLAAIQIRSLGSFLFNAVSDATLYPLLALHRWLICLLDQNLPKSNENVVSVQFGDVKMDETWGTCSVVANDFSVIFDPSQMQNAIQNSVNGFVSYTMALLSGIGNTVLSALLLTYDSMIAIFVGMVWGMQNVMYAFNPSTCRVSDYMQKIVLQCACGDTPYMIPEPQRDAHWYEGGLWCSGALTITLLDGTTGVIFNPYSLNELSAALVGVTSYIQCLSQMPSSSASYNDVCKPPKGISALPVLTNQRVQPIAVWAKCKSNYLLQTWDQGAGALFSDELSSSLVGFSIPLQTERKNAQEWAKKISPDFLACLASPARFNLDYSLCMNMYLNLTTKRLPNAYFLYSPTTIRKTTTSSFLNQTLLLNASNYTEPPDACLVFSGLNASSSSKQQTKAISSLSNTLQECMWDSSQGNPSACPFNPSIWSIRSPANTPVAKLFGTTTSSKSNIQAQYVKLRQQMELAFQRFNQTFRSTAKRMKIELFSADGDFIHDFFDCVFLGPYTRVDLLPCDLDGRLECPFYARDEHGGKTRQFTACYGKELQGDINLPFTCGSQTRRALIKYFFREYALKHFDAQITELLMSRVNALWKNLTNVYSYGCLDKNTGVCKPEACQKEANAYAPCLDTDFTVSSTVVSQFLLKELLSQLDGYLRFVLQDTAPWSLYYNLSLGNNNNNNNNNQNDQDKSFIKSKKPGQWDSDTVSSNIVVEQEGIFKPNIPIVQYDLSEGYSMPTHEESDIKRLEGSVWSLCMSLLSQGMLTLPIIQTTTTTSTMNVNEKQEERNISLPFGIDLNFLKGYEDKLNDLNAVADLVRNLTEKAMASKSPFRWHKEKRHAPTPSAICQSTIKSKASTKSAQTQTEIKQKKPLQTFGFNRKIHMGPVQFSTTSAAGQNQYMVQEQSDLIQGGGGRSFPFHGFTWGSLGYSICPCGIPFLVFSEKFDMNSIEENKYLCQITNEICLKANMTLSYGCLRNLCFLSQKNQGIRPEELWQCIHSLVDPPIKCEELSPSDSWGLFPMDCTSKTCLSAQGWVGNAYQDVTFEGIRLVTEGGRSGLKLSNYKYVNDTFHTAINYGAQKHHASYYSQSYCFESTAIQNEEEIMHDTSIDDFVSTLFPAIQLLYESPVIAYCSRFVVETARAQALSSFVDQQERAFEAQQQASRWQIKCHSKLRHLGSCSKMGIYYDILPPMKWPELTKQHCIEIKVREGEGWDSKVAYITPWCIVIHRVKRQMYDARLCLKAAMTPNERKNTISKGIPSERFLTLADLKENVCGLPLPQPLDFLQLVSPAAHLATVYTLEKKRLVSDAKLLHSQWNLQTISEFNMKKRDEPISQVLDWWPENEIAMPPGYHITATAMELAPVIFDSHYAWDEEENLLHYVHTGLRNASLINSYLGAGGLCRAHSIGMPLFETNTNRYCTRNPLRKNSSGENDTPHLPVDLPFSIPRVLTSEYISSNFEPLICASTSKEVPWLKREDQFEEAGDLPTIQHDFNMDSYGTAFYQYQTYPTRSTPMNPIKDLYHEWGEICSKSIEWDSSPPCKVSTSFDSNQKCPKNTACLPLHKTKDDGMCFSIEAFRKDNARMPCFTTEHCPDGLVCLADGGCSPLYLHMWNSKATGIQSLEFGILADDCGFDKLEHPYTQNLRGASAWEQVPDLFHAHGMCSHRSWFAYRNAIQDQVCPIVEPIFEGDGKKHLACNVSTAIWPNIQMHFDGCRTSPNLRPTMEDLNTLVMKPHPCDRDYMHLSLSSKKNNFTADTNDGTKKHSRMQLCSGYQGQKQTSTSQAYMTYHLSNENSELQEGEDLLIAKPSSSSNATIWMRTFEENTNILHVGHILPDGPYNNSLGFLGGELGANNPVLSGLATGNIRFFRCADRIACQMPEFTFGGARMDPRLDSITGFNFTETSLRRCGAIGSLMLNGENSHICKLDLTLFPLFAYLLEHMEENNVRGCWSLFSPLFIQSFLSTLPTSWKTMPLANSQILYCCSSSGGKKCDTNHKVEEKSMCIYASRINLPEIKSIMIENDGIAQITQRLNGLFTGTTSRILDLIKSQGAMTTYEDINICSKTLNSYTAVLQAEIQRKYNSPIPSGFYIAFRISLYEFPQQWFHQCMLNILLGAILSNSNRNYNGKRRISVSIPDTTQLLDGALFLDLWSTTRLNELCSTISTRNNPLSSSNNNNDNTIYSLYQQTLFKSESLQEEEQNIQRKIFGNDEKETIGLLRLICLQKHPKYTFSEQTSTLPLNLVSQVHSAVVMNANDALYENQKSSALQCYTSGIWKKDEPGMQIALRKFYKDIKCNHQSIGDTSTTVLDPCKGNISTSFFQWADRQLIDIQGLKTNQNVAGYNLANYLQSCTQSILNQANSLSNRLDYIMGGGSISNTNNNNKVAIAQIWPIDTGKFQGFFNMDIWAQQACNERIPRPFCAPSQSTMIHTGKEKDPCLYETEMEHFEDTLRYFSDGPPVITIIANNDKHEIPICPTSNDKKIRYIFQTTDLGYNQEDSSSGGKFLIPAIKEVTAPPGVHIMAFTGRGSKETWSQKVLPSSDILKHCTWTSLDDRQPSWWPGGVMHPKDVTSLDEDLYVNFDSMPLWYDFTSSSGIGGASNSLKPNWLSQGCGGFRGVIALAYTLDSNALSSIPSMIGSNTNTILSTTSMHCQNSAGMKQSNNKLPILNYISVKPICGNDIHDGTPLRPFLLKDSSTFSLWRCGPCSKYKVQAVQKGQGMFGCTLANGAPMSELFTEESLSDSFPYLYETEALQNLLISKDQSIGGITKRIFTQNQSSVLEVMVDLEDMGNLATMAYWGGIQMSDASCFKPLLMQECKAFNDGQGYDPTIIIQQERSILQKAISNPSIPFTMTCEGQQYTSRSQEHCNPIIDKRRQYLSDFVEQQYRQTNGVWLQQVPEGMGMAFQANVAHSAVGQFTLFYTSGDRPKEEVASAWALGNGPCASNIRTVLEDRICAESTIDSGRFEPFHPWLGGDINPFMGILDECPFRNPLQCQHQGYSSSELFTSTIINSAPQICPCACSPAWACTGTSFNYSDEFMEKEFPTQSVCSIQMFSQSRVMDTSDVSHVCKRLASLSNGNTNNNDVNSNTLSSTSSCKLSHGLLGGKQGNPVTNIQFHSEEGFFLSNMASDESNHHVLLPNKKMSSTMIQEDNFNNNNNLWGGSLLDEQDEAFFLSMPRDRLHPAHIGFGLDTSLANLPLKIQGIGLLPFNHMKKSKGNTNMFPTNLPNNNWVQTLRFRWQAEIQTARIFDLYPQLNTQKNTNTIEEERKDWSCPIRKMIFWGSTTEGFGPITPNPVVTALLYPDLMGIHPFIKPEGPYKQKADYFTPNGICYYREEATTRPVLNVASEIQSQCSLLGTLKFLSTFTEVPITIQEPFENRCNDIIDTPDVGGKLRSGETLIPSEDLSAKCGLLHRLSPALISVKGDAVPVRTSTLFLTTSSEGGDCHMGRAAKIPMNKLQGHQCYTIKKDFKHLKFSCKILKEALRSRPLTLNEILASERSTVVYQSDFNGWPTFKGPNGINLPEAEISFGQIYSPTLKETLSADLLFGMSNFKRIDNEPWIGNKFWEKYLNGTLLMSSNDMNSIEKILLDNLKGKSLKENLITTAKKQKQQNEDEILKAIQEDLDLWSQKDWVWSFLSKPQSKGNLSSKDAWMKNRTQTCNASMEAYITSTEGASDLIQQQGIRRIALCAPAPTGDLATLCTEMTQFSIDVAQANCQLVGQGDCIANLGMFYLPYMWSSTNQAYSYTTVMAYYKQMLSNFFPEASSSNADALCAAPEIDPSFLDSLAKLSAQQNALCPATSMELLKRMLEQLRVAGNDLLHLSFSFTMMVVNFIAATFTIGHGDASVYLEAATKYMDQVLYYVKEILSSLLDVFTEMLATISAVGKAFATIINVLCIFFNFILETVVAYFWCLIVRPCVIGILMAIRALAFFSSDTANAMQSLLDQMGNSDPLSCVVYYRAEARLECPFDNPVTFNVTGFQVQPMATLCWSKSQQGGGIYSGGANDLLLSCTSSDTCALEPLRYDSGLVYCGSCPSAQVGGAFQFGCDVYLQRCVCGTQSYTKSECLKNSDCQQPGMKCGVGPTVDSLRGSYVSIDCSACGGMLGLSPICMLDGQGSAGICGCANLIDDLQKCQTLGTPTVLGASTQLCPVVMDSSSQQLLANSIQPEAIVLSFSDVAITYCHLSTRINLCLNLQIPIVEGNLFQDKFVVLLSLLVSASPSITGRRLLSSTSVTPMLAQAVFREWLIEHEQDIIPKQICNQTGGFKILKEGKNLNEYRQFTKKCLYWSQLGAFTVHHFNLSGISQPYTLFSSETGILLALPSLANNIAQDSELIQFLMLHMPYGRTLLDMSTAFSNLFNGLKHQAFPTISTTVTSNTTTEDQNFKKETNHCLTEIFNQTKNEQTNRKLLQNDENEMTEVYYYGDWTFNCTSVKIPIDKLARAFWDTVQYYEMGQEGLMNMSVQCDMTQGFYNCLGYSLPPGRESSSSMTMEGGNFLLEVLLYVPTLGAGPNKLVDAFLSSIPHEEAERKDLITGTRLLQDMGVCNFTRLTKGPVKLRSFLPMFLFLLLLFTIVSYTCLPLSVCTSFLWMLIFPIILFWAMYNISPLCWPMIPPRFVYDVHQEINALIPTQITVPRYLVRPQCTVTGKLSDGSYDPTCFLGCTEPPFLFKSWQDTLSWWTCEASTSMCLSIAKSLEPWNLFQDLVSSANYYASVIEYTNKDKELVQAHRICAMLSLYHTVLFLMMAAVCCYLLPSLFLAVLDIFMGVLLLIMETYNAEQGD